MRFPYFAVACGLLLLGVATMAGCKRQDYATDPRVTEQVARVNEGEGDLVTVTDPKTGCQYLGYLSHGLTPRLVWDEKRQEMSVMGCRIVEHE